MDTLLTPDQTAERLPWAALADEIEALLRDPAVRVPERIILPTAQGAVLFVMPAADARVAMTKLISFTPANTGTDIPIRSIASLGGADRMRGYYNGRYRDDHLMSLQAEYRVPVYKRFSAVGFAGVGDVTGRSSTISIRNMKYSYGGGLRFAVNKNEKLHIRLDYGFGKGKGNQGFYLQFGEAF